MDHLKVSETFTYLVSTVSDLQVVSDVNAITDLFNQLMISFFFSGLILKSAFGPLPFPLVVFLIEGSRAGLLLTLGSLNFSYLIQFSIIHNQRYLNKSAQTVNIYFSKPCLI